MGGLLKNSGFSGKMFSIVMSFWYVKYLDFLKFVKKWVKKLEI